MSAAGFRSENIPSIILACKSDIQRMDLSETTRAVELFGDVVEVSSRTEEGKSKMRKIIEVIIRRIGMFDMGVLSLFY